MDDRPASREALGGLASGSTTEVCCKDSIAGLRVIDLPIINTDLEIGSGIGFPPAMEIFRTKVCRPTASSSAHRVQLLHRQYVLLQFTPPPSWLSRTHSGTVFYYWILMVLVRDAADGG
jgi:hypothetical protein